MADRVRGCQLGQEITPQALSRRRFLLRTAAAGMLPAGLFPAEALRAESPAGGSSDRAALGQAQQAIPRAKLSPAARRKVDAVLHRVTVFRRTPVKPVYCTPELFRFLVLHPDVLVGLWRVLGISRVRLRRTGRETFAADDGAGTQSDVEFLHHGQGYHLVYSVGRYHGPLAPRPIRGGCLLQLHYAPVPQATVPMLLTRMELFVRIDNLAVDLITRAFRNTVGKMADLNYRETVAFVGQMYRVARVRPELLHQMAAHMTGVTREDRRRFVQLVYQTAGVEPPEELLPGKPQSRESLAERTRPRQEGGPRPDRETKLRSAWRRRWSEGASRNRALRR